MWTLLTALLLNSPAQAQQFGDRGGVALTGSAGVLPAMPSYEGPRLSPPAGCFGVDGVLLLPDRRRPGKRRRYFPNNKRTVFGAEGCGGPANTYFLGFGAGAGGQWGARDLYTTAHVVAGLGSYEQNYRGQSYNVVGIWVRPKVAAGFQLGEDFAIEMGPAIHTIVPLLQSYQGQPPIGRFLGIVTFDITILAGSGAPLRW